MHCGLAMNASGGTRLFPVTVFLCGKAAEGPPEKTKQVTSIASIIFFILYSQFI
jgi:hypothetical protein